MERKRLPYKISLIVFLWLVLLSCGKEDFKVKNIGDSNDNLFTFVKEYKIPGNKELALASQITTSDDKKFYFSNLFARSILFCKRPFNEYKKIGRWGKGPAEYISPIYIQSYKNTIYFSDLRNNFIKSININSKSYIDSSYYVTTKMGARRFCVDKDYIYVLNDIDALLKIYNRKNGELKQKLFEQNLFSNKNKFNKINNSTLEGGIVTDSLKNIFLVPPAPFIIYHVKYDGENFILKQKWDLTTLPYVKNLTQKKFKRDIVSKISIVLMLALVGKGHQYLIVHILNGHTGYYYILSKSGKLIDIYQSYYYTLLGSYKENVFFRYSNKDKELFIKEYKYNDR